MCVRPVFVLVTQSRRLEPGVGSLEGRNSRRTAHRSPSWSPSGLLFQLLYGRVWTDSPHVHPDVTHGSSPDQLQSPPGFSLAPSYFPQLLTLCFSFYEGVCERLHRVQETGTCRRSRGRIAPLRADGSSGSPSVIDQSAAANGLPPTARAFPANLSISILFLAPLLLSSDCFWAPASIHHPLPRVHAHRY